MSDQVAAKTCVDPPPCPALTFSNPWALCLANSAMRRDSKSSAKKKDKAEASSPNSSPLRTWRGKLGLVKLFLRKAQPFYYLELTGDFVSLSGKYPSVCLLTCW